jgi:integrase
MFKSQASPKEGGAIGPTKGGRVRVAAIPSNACTVLVWWRQHSPHSGKADLVFYGSASDHPLNRSTFPDVLGRALTAAKVKVDGRFLTTHSVRHTFNTMISRSIPADTLRALIGHSCDRMTAHYDHPTPCELVKSLQGSRTAIEKAAKW